MKSAESTFEVSVSIGNLLLSQIKNNILTTSFQ